MVVVVTGASSGIGLEIAKKLSRKFEVINISRSASSAAKIEFQTDLGTEEGLQRACDFIRRTNGLNTLINCAGIMPLTHFPKQDMTSYNQIMNVNLRAPFFLSQATLEKNYPDVTIINIASIAGMSASLDSDLITYGVSKSALIYMTEMLGHQYPLARIFSISPGLIRGTGLVMGELEPPDELVQKIPMKRPGERHEVASLVLWLMCEGPSFIRKGNFVIDGGQL